MKIIEQFKPFPLNPAVMVGNMGTPNGRRASKAVDSVGYLKISIAIGLEKSFKQHRVCAITWKPNPLNLPDVNHLDGIKTNNAQTNLEWTTHADNIRHGRKLGLWTKPGGRPAGYRASDETKAKQSAAKLGKFRDGHGGKWLTKKPKYIPPTGIIKSESVRNALWAKKFLKRLKDGDFDR